MMAFIMVMIMTLPVVAAGLPTESDTATIKVTGVESGAKVTAYRIVKPIYTTGGGYSGYEPVLSGSIVDVTAPTAAEIFALAGRKTELTETVVMTESDSDYTATVKAGTWMILVESNGTSLAKVYNPMIVSAYYENDVLKEGSVSGSATWTDEGKTVAKATEPEVNKVIVKDDRTEAKGDDKAVGDKFNFKVTSQIPSYGSEYVVGSIIYELVDVLTEGLTLDSSSIVVTVGENRVDESANTYTKTINDDGYKIAFADSFVRANGQANVKITYSATLNDKAVSGFDPDKNTVTLNYSTSFTGTTSSKTSKTYQYTFAIDSKLTGQSGVTKITHEIIKVDANTYREYTYSDEDYTAGIPGALSGAEFTLYKEDKTTVVKTVTSDATGHLEFTGLDAGTYYLKETKAPSGYKLDTTEHKVVISAVYNPDGTLKSYSITIDDQATSTYTATYNGEGTITNIEGAPIGTAIFKNTKIGELPSTGGIGAYLFTIAGVSIMAAAIGMLIIRKRNN